MIFNTSAAPSVNDPSTTMSQWTAGGTLFMFPQFLIAGVPGTYNGYRRMLENPTLALCWEVARAIVKTPEWSIEVDDGVPDDVVKVLEKTFVDQRIAILNHVTRAMVFGWTPFELVWGMVDGRQSVTKFKPLLPDISRVVIDEKSGTVLGLDNTGVRLGMGVNDLGTGAGKGWFYAHDGEAEMPYGRSRLENVRCTAYQSWTDTWAKLGKYATKAAGVVPIIRSPVQYSENEDGETKANNELAEKILRDMTVALGIVMPSEVPPGAYRLIEKFPALLEHFQWKIEFLKVEPGIGSELNEMLKADEVRMVRGFFGPERGLLEGQFGTKAEAGVHQAIALTIFEQFLHGVIADLNRNVVDVVLARNWGDAYKGKARVCAGPLSDAEKAFFRGLIRDLLLNPTALEVAATLTDLDSMFDQSGVPKAQQVITTPGAMLPGGVPGVPPGGTGGTDPMHPDNAPKPPNTPGRATMAMSRLYRGLLSAFRS